MLQAQNEFSRDCHERAARARANADAVTDPHKKAEYLDAEARWLALAQSGSLVERLSRFVASKNPRAHFPPNTRLGDFWPVAFERGQTVISPGQQVSTVLFISDAVISLVASSGLEIAMLGADAGIGMLQALHGGPYPYEAVVRVSGSGMACSATSFKDFVHASAAVLQNVLMAEQQIASLIAQTAVCNSGHPSPARLAKWFACLHQLSGRLEFEVTQDELSILLGVTRPTVSVAQDQLRHERLLEYSRGRVRLLDPARLKSRACECGAFGNDTHPMP